MRREKKCGKCKKALGVEYFYKNKSAWDGLDHYCKECNTKRMRIYFRSPAGKASLRRQRKLK